MKAEFNKANFSEDTLREAIEKQKKYFESNLKDNYKLISVTGSNTNGLSVYINVLRDGETKDFQFRISDHQNGNNFGITDGTLSYQGNNVTIADMYAFYGDITKDEARISFLEAAIEKYTKKEGKAYEGLVKQLEALKKK